MSPRRNPRTCWLVLAAVLIGCGTGQSGAADTDAGNNSNPVCGNGVLETGEQCDDGSENSDSAPNACRTDCHSAHCGDTVIDTSEICDGTNRAGETCETQGFTKGGLGCLPDCSDLDTSGCSSCGNDVAELDEPTEAGYETCDGIDLRGQDCIGIGQAAGTLGCSPTCGWDISGCTGGTACGNTVVEAGEECDDGNIAACDGCSSTCLIEVCGNGTTDCGETCDDGNLDAGDGCGPTCLVEGCGNGYLDAGEVCDDGNTIDADGCSADCTSDESCGNGILDPAEDCDASDILPGDGCGPTCLFEVCGNSYVDPGEECDDGNTDAQDGCDPLCQIEHWTLVTLPSNDMVYDIWGSSASDVFAVGVGGTIMHYDGTSWSTMVSNTTAQLWKVWGSGPADVWAVGQGPTTVMHYDGTWSAVAGPFVPGDVLRAVFGFGPADVWVAGNADQFYHFNGVGWTIVAPDQPGAVYDMWGASPTDIWASGSNYVWHYDGAGWTRTEPNVGLWVYYDVWGSGPNDVWFTVTNSNDLLRFDGVSLSTVTIPAAFEFWGVFGFGPNDVYLPGWLGIWHYDGAWTMEAAGLGLGFGRPIWGASPTDMWSPVDNGVIAHRQ